MVDDFGSSLRAEGLAVNTVNSYLSSFRALCHTALREGLPGPASDPFAGLHLKREETAKRALKIAEVNKVMQADYPGEPSLREALDPVYFLLSRLRNPLCGPRLPDKEKHRGRRDRLLPA